MLAIYFATRTRRELELAAEETIARLDAHDHAGARGVGGLDERGDGA